MSRIKSIVIVELCAILIYIIITLFSITIQPINLIFGIFCIMVIPGYNLVRIFKPQSTFILKIVYTTILSIAVVNIFMFFSYFFLYDFTLKTEDKRFFFDPILLITSLQILNLTLIVLNELILSKKSNSINTNTKNIRNRNPVLNFIVIFKKINLKSLISYIVFLLSVIFLCLSTYYSSVSDNSFSATYVDYRANFTFFLRVPYLFYIFLIILIVSLGYIIFSTKNKYLKLLSISIFLYTLWILPFLQIKNIYNHDTKLLFDLYRSYLDFGINPSSKYSLTQILFKDLFVHRYSTSIFTTILLVNSTKINEISTIMFLYPLFYVSIPFFFYTIFHKYSKKKVENPDNSYIFILTIFAILVPQFIKFGHSATTGVIGTFIFFILVLEFYSFVNEREFNRKQIIFIGILFFFIAITHTEECIYFLIFAFIYSLFQIFIKYLNTDRNDLSERKKLRKLTLNWAILLLLLSLIFYFTQEFFGWIPSYIYMIFPKGSSIRSFIFDIYFKSKFLFLVSLQNTFTMSYVFILLISLGILLFYYLFFMFLIGFKKLITKINEYGRKMCKLFNRLIIKVNSKKYFLFVLTIIIYSSFIIIDWLFYPFLRENGFLFIIEFVLNSFIFVINIFLFIVGIKYYRIRNNTQNFYLIAIFSCSLVFSIFFLIGNYFLGIYVFVYRFFSIFVFFNLIIIEGTFFRDSMTKNKIFKMTLVIILLFFGVFYSLRTLAYG